MCAVAGCLNDSFSCWRVRDTQLGRGFAARGVSYAGHGVGEDVVVGTSSSDDQDHYFHGRMRRDKRTNESIHLEGQKRIC